MLNQLKDVQSDDILRAGVMGWPVAHSLSPHLHGYWLQHYGIKGSYERFPVEPASLPHAMADLRKNAQGENGLRGVNLTVPHKEAVIGLLDRVDPLAARAGAVNTVTVSADGVLTGRNTDIFGFTQNLLAGGYKAGKRPVVLLGAGGASRAAIVALMDMSVREIRLLNRTRDRAEQMAESFPDAPIKVFGLDDAAALTDAELVINATSLGMRGQPMLELSLDKLSTDALVTDMVYAPLMTDLLLRAQARGNPVVDGLGMLLHQARPAFEAFFARDPEVTAEVRNYVLAQIPSP